MSDKPQSKLWEIDRLLNRLAIVGPAGENGTQITIELVQGFELFNTRPYHNYETWSTGWHITGYGITVRKEDLDDAVREFVRKVEESRPPCKSWERGVISEEELRRRAESENRGKE